MIRKFIFSDRNHSGKVGYSSLLLASVAGKKARSQARRRWDLLAAESGPSRNMSASIFAFRGHVPFLFQKYDLSHEKSNEKITQILGQSGLGYIPHPFKNWRERHWQIPSSELLLQLVIFLFEPRMRLISHILDCRYLERLISMEAEQSTRCCHCFQFGFCCFVSYSIWWPQCIFFYWLTDWVFPFFQISFRDAHGWATISGTTLVLSLHTRFVIRPLRCLGLKCVHAWFRGRHLPIKIKRLISSILSQL